MTLTEEEKIGGDSYQSFVDDLDAYLLISLSHPNVPLDGEFGDEHENVNDAVDGQQQMEGSVDVLFVEQRLPCFLLPLQKWMKTIVCQEIVLHQRNCFQSLELMVRNDDAFGRDESFSDYIWFWQNFGFVLDS